MTKDAKSCANFAVSALEDKKGQDVVVLDITKDINSCRLFCDCYRSVTSTC
jgi:ribosomal silencing factor RsfS